MRRPIRLVALTGLAGSGKSTAAEALAERAGWTRMSFADPLRQMLLGLGVSMEQMKNQKTVPIGWCGGKTPREMLQTLGTEWGRKMIDPNLWASALRHRILHSEGDRIVIDDCRFDNEAEMIRGLGGYVIRIDRPGLTAMPHASEAGVSDRLVHTTLHNTHPDALGIGRDLLYVLNLI